MAVSWVNGGSGGREDMVIAPSNFRVTAQFRKLLAQLFIFQLPRFDTVFDRVHTFADLIRCITWRDVLRAVPVVGFDMDDEHPLDHRPISRHADMVQPALCFLTFEDLHAAQYLQASLPGIVDHDESHAVVAQQIARADELLVSAIICESERVIIDDFEKAFWTATMLDIRPRCCSYCCPIKAVAFDKKLSLELSEAIVRNS